MELMRGVITKVKGETEVLIGLGDLNPIVTLVTSPWGELPVPL
jgi:hypothetical protein